jgi:SAM-dependent methyltransferase
MHDSAIDKARTFREAYLAKAETTPLAILDVGSAIVDPTQKSNRLVFDNPQWRMIGLDIEPGLNVEVVVKDPYDWTEIESGSVDVVTCSEVFEHAEFFWITMLEIARVLKVNGLAFITSPGSGPLHRFPVDCWRFYDDSFHALGKYSQLLLLESQVQWAPAYRKGMQWRDATGIFQRPARSADEETAAFARIAAGKLLARSHMEPQTFARLPAAPASVAVSPIGPKTGLDALGRRETELLRTTSSLRRKSDVILRYLREIGRVARSPLKEIRY